MALVELKFPGNINISAQVGDTVYFCKSDYSSIEEGFDVQDGNIIEIGVITAISENPDVTLSSAVYSTTVIVNQTMTPSIGETIQDAYAYLPTQGQDFVFFSKDNIVNMSSPIGYYAQVKFVNNSTVKSEMFATACEVFESSK